MKEGFLDVTLEIPLEDVAASPDGVGDVLNKIQHEAEKQVDEVGGRIRTTIKPEVIIKRGVKAVTGEDYLLVAARVPVEVPEKVDLRSGHGD